MGTAVTLVLAFIALALLGLGLLVSEPEPTRGLESLMVDPPRPVDPENPGPLDYDG